MFLEFVHPLETFRMYPTDFARIRSRRLTLVIAGLLACAGLLTACAHDDVEQQEEAVATATRSPKAFKVNHDDWQKVGYKLDWIGYPFVGEADNDEGDVEVTTLHAYGDIVVGQDRQSTVTTLEASNGQTRWSTQLAGPLTRFVGMNRDPYDPSRIIVSSESEAFTLAAASGNIVGRERFSRVVNTQPVMIGNLVICGTSTGEILAHSLGRGVKAWGFVSVGSIVAKPVAMGDGIAAVSQGGDVLFLNSGGSLIGRGQIYEGLDNDPVAEGDMLFIAGRDRSVWAFDTAGNRLWRYRTSSPLTAQPTAHGGVVYVDIPGQGLTAFEEPTGRVMWSSAKVSGTVIGSRHGKLLVNKGETLTLVDPARGDVLEQITVPNLKKIVVDNFDDGKIYAVNNHGVVAKFVPR
jgi:outer membrane protein assembly factor BamB